MSQITLHLSSESRAAADPNKQRKEQTTTQLRLTNPPDRENFHFSYITDHDVIKALWRIKTKAEGIDRINITLLNKIIDIILPTVTHIFNASLMTSTTPHCGNKPLYAHSLRPKSLQLQMISDPLVFYLPYQKLWNV